MLYLKTDMDGLAWAFSWKECWQHLGCCLGRASHFGEKSDPHPCRSAGTHLLPVLTMRVIITLFALQGTFFPSPAGPGRPGQSFISYSLKLNLNRDTREFKGHFTQSTVTPSAFQ